MKVGVCIYSKWPYAEVIDAFVRHGIQNTFVCVDHPQFEDVMQMLAEKNIAVANFHAPYRGANAIWQEGEDGERILKDYFMHSVDMCVRYNVPIMVLHASNGRPMPPISEVGINRFDRLMAYAKSKGVQVAFESHRYLENVQFMMERYPEAGFCLDTCHAHGFTPGLDYMPMWGHRLIATHISDNDNVCDKDMHMLPFDGIIDFERVTKQIAESGYDGVLMLEIKPDNHELYKDVSIDAYYAAAAERANKLGEMADKYGK